MSKSTSSSQVQQSSPPSTQPANMADLANINKKILAEGEQLPAVTLKDGSKVQTGTVATMLHNVTLYNEGARGDIEKELELSVPTLVKVGLFDLFSPEEWIAGTNPGRRFVGTKALEFFAQQERP
ncbi:hypothetical protein BGX20_001981 [Mortierella sp. AD010]|nr:hypothetical protein BGX20_001981 [Mortierella sp. AD010]